MSNYSANEKIYLDEIQAALREMMSCLKTFSLYPKNHPAQGPVLERVFRRFEDLLRDRESLSLGVSENEVILFGEEEKEHRIASDLAERLHQHGILTLRIDRGVSKEDLGLLLRSLPGSQDRPAAEEAIDLALQKAGVQKIALSLVDYRQIIEQEAPALSESVPEDVWTGLIQQAQQGDQAALRQMAGRLADPSGLREMNLQIKKSLSGLSPEGSATAPANLLADIHQQIFDSLTQKEQEKFAASLADLALSEDQDGAGQDSEATRTFLAYRDEILLKVMAGSVARQGKIDNRISTVLQAVFQDKARRQGLHNTADSYARKRSSGGYTPEIWNQVRCFFLSGSEEQFMSHEYHRVLEDLNRFHLAELRQIISPDYLDQVQTDLRPDVLRKIRRDLLFDLVQQADGPEPMEGTPREIGLLLAEHARNLDMESILKALKRLFDPPIPVSLERKVKLSEMLFETNEDSWISRLIREVGNMGEAEFPLLKQILNYCNTGLGEILIRQLGEEGSISGRKRLSSLLVGLGSRAVPAIVDFLDDARWFLVRNLVMILGKIGDPSCVEDLLVLLSHEHFLVRREVLLTLSMIGGDRAVPQIRRILLNRSRKEEAGVQITAARALKRIGTEKSQKVLQEGFEDKDKKVQEICCQVIKGLI